MPESSDLQNFDTFFRFSKFPLVSTSKVYEKNRHFCRPGAHTALHSYGRKKLQHVTWPVRILTREILKIWKKCQNPEIPRILALFQICKIPLVSTLIGCEKCQPFCRIGAFTDAMVWKNWDTLLAILGCLKMKFRKSKKVTESSAFKLENPLFGFAKFHF